MAKIKLLIEDDHGQPMGTHKEYHLAVGGGTLTEIEAAVEQFKRSSLPDIEQQLLAHSQAEVLKKKAP